MAGFTVNIAADITAPYSGGINTTSTLNNCAAVSETYAMVLIKDIVDHSLLGMLQSYSGLALKTLHITDVHYTVPSDFYMEYNLY